MVNQSNSSVTTSTRRGVYATLGRTTRAHAMLNMYSMLVVKDCVKADADDASHHNSLSSLDAHTFLPTKEDIHILQLNFTVFSCSYSMCTH